MRKRLQHRVHPEPDGFGLSQFRNADDAADAAHCKNFKARAKERQYKTASIARWLLRDWRHSLQACFDPLAGRAKTPDDSARRAIDSVQRREPDLSATDFPSSNGR